MAQKAREVDCLFCWKRKVRLVGKGEHVVPKELGGTKGLVSFGKGVCGDCNNGPLSLADRELTSRSYLSMVASKELGNDIYQAWDTDHASDGLLVETSPTWDDGDTLLISQVFPQMIFDGENCGIRFGRKDLDAYGLDASGCEKYCTLMLQLVKSAYERHISDPKKNAIFFEPIAASSISEGQRYPPRVFVRHPMTEIEHKLDKQSIILRYLDNEGKEHALSMMAKLTGKPKVKEWGEGHGSQRAAVSLNFNRNLVFRGMVKIAFNFLAAYATKTDFSHPEYRILARSIIEDEYRFTEQLETLGGFLPASQIEFMLCPPDSHAFWLIHHEGFWFCYSSYFGGKLGSRVVFKATNFEDWSTLKAVVPIRSPKWEVTTSSSVITSPVTTPRWGTIGDLLPSFGVQSSKAGVYSVPAKVKKRK